MIEQPDLHRLCRVAKQPGDLQVRGAGRRIAAGMVVGADDRAGRLPDRRPEDFPRMGQGGSSPSRRRPRPA